MSITDAFEKAFVRKHEKGWEKIYVIVDIHDTILHACYDKGESYDYFPFAKEALQMMSSRDDICLILWSGSPIEILKTYRDRFAVDGILFEYINENPEVENSAFQDFDKKLYFNVGIDDRFGFEPEKDWEQVTEALFAK
ncbi:MAG: hypothetical protein IKX60_05910 [Bacteroidales bacterium]|nr:hypothetical protein [Bacteroidales bacterium]